jgi:hypothetical protein
MNGRRLWDGNNARYRTDEDTPHAVIAAYKTAAARSSIAFEVAVRAYRVRHPSASLQVARRRVAEIICFAGS